MEFVRGYEVPVALLRAQEALPTHVSLEPLLAARTGTQLGDSAGRLDTQTRQSRSKRVGRKVSKVNQVLRAFQRKQMSSTYQPPKLENVRYRVMRTLKKVLRRLSNGKPPGHKALLAMNYQSQAVAVAFQRFREYAEYQGEIIREFYEVANGPKVDKGRLKEERESRFFTYNNSYMMHIFAKAEIRLVYRLFIEFVFSENHPSSLNDRFNIWCCKSSQHSAACISKWQSFRLMLDQYLGTDLPEGTKEEPTPAVLIRREALLGRTGTELEGGVDI